MLVNVAVCHRRIPSSFLFSSRFPIFQFLSLSSRYSHTLSPFTGRKETEGRAGNVTTGDNCAFLPRVNIAISFSKPVRLDTIYSFIRTSFQRGCMEKVRARGRSSTERKLWTKAVDKNTRDNGKLRNSRTFARS